MKSLITLILTFFYSFQVVAGDWVQIEHPQIVTRGHHKFFFDLLYCSDDSGKTICQKSLIVDDLSKREIDIIKRRTTKAAVWVTGVVTIRYAITIFLFWGKLLQGIYTLGRVALMLITGALFLSPGGKVEDESSQQQPRYIFKTPEQLEEFIENGGVVIGDHQQTITPKELEQLKKTLKTKQDCRDFTFFERFSRQINPVALIPGSRAFRYFREQVELFTDRGGRTFRIDQFPKDISAWDYFKLLESHVKNFLENEELNLAGSQCN